MLSTGVWGVASVICNSHCGFAGVFLENRRNKDDDPNVNSYPEKGGPVAATTQIRPHDLLSAAIVRLRIDATPKLKKKRENG